MPQLILDTLDAVAAWSALQPDGVTPSAALGITAVSTPARLDPAGKVARIESSGANGHLLRRSIPSADLGEFDELRLWIWSQRVADGASGTPFFLELRVASAAMGFGDPANTWSRLLPVEQPGAWNMVRVTLADLPGAARSAVNQVQLRCLDPGAWVCYLDDLIAVREAMLGDADAALMARLDGRFLSGGVPVPAAFVLPESGAAPELPCIRITQYDARYEDERTPSGSVRSDFVGPGFSLRPAGFAYAVYYEIDVLAGTRAVQAPIYDFVLGALPPRGTLVVNGEGLPLDWVAVEALDQFGRRITERTLLHYRLSTRQSSGPSVPGVPPFHAVVVEAEPLSGP